MSGVVYTHLIEDRTHVFRVKRSWGLIFLQDETGEVLAYARSSHDRLRLIIVNEDFRALPYIVRRDLLVEMDDCWREKLLARA